MIVDSNNTLNQEKQQLFDIVPDDTNLYQSPTQTYILESESTIDLSNIVIKAMPIVEHSTNNQQKPTATTTTFTELDTINLADLETATADMLKRSGKLDDSKFTNLTSANLNSGYRNDLQFEDNSNSQYYEEDDDDDDDDYDDDEEYQVKPGNKRTRATPRSINAKRFSTASTSSSTQMTTMSTAPIVKSTKGRKPKSETSVGAKITGESDVARFGNKYVKKGTQEYEVRRNRNNEAVKKCREKSQVKQNEREERLKILTEENRKLSNTVDSLNKELAVLKNILLQMNPQNRLPSELEEKINRLESMILSNNTINNNAKS